MRHSIRNLAVVLALAVIGALAWRTDAIAATAASPAAVPAQLSGIGIAAHRPVFGGACKDCPWGVVADVVKQALVPYGYDLQVCYHCFMADAPRIVGDARMPPPWSPNMAGDVLGPNEIPAPPNARVEFGATADQLMVAAYDGTGPYARDGPRHQLRLIATISSPVFLIVAVKRSAGIADLSQLKDHKG